MDARLLTYADDSRWSPQDGEHSAPANLVINDQKGAQRDSVSGGDESGDE